QVNAVAISPGSTWLVTASADRTVRRWHADSHECAAILRTDAKLLAVCWQAGNLIAACGPPGICTPTLTGTTGRRPHPAALPPPRFQSLGPGTPAPTHTIR